MRPRQAVAALTLLPAVAALVAACSSSGAVQIGTFSAVPQPKVTISPVSCSSLPLRPRPAAGGVPDVSLRCLGPGATVSLARLRGPALVNIWGSWCGPCVEELPVLAAFAAANPAVAVVGVDTGDRTAAPAIAELSVAGVRYPNLVDFPGTVRAAGAGPVPTTYLVDAAGRIVFRHAGPYADAAALQADVLAHLGVPARR